MRASIVPFDSARVVDCPSSMIDSVLRCLEAGQRRHARSSMGPGTATASGPVIVTSSPERLAQMKNRFVRAVVIRL
jgi:hypothetical protein